MKVLVTGAGGFVGSALVRRLAGEAGYSVRAAARSIPPAAHDGVEWVASPPLSRTADWSGVLDGAGSVVHLAAMVHVMSPGRGATDAEFQSINVHGTVRLAEQCVARGVRRFIFLSSVKVHGERGALTEASPAAPVDAYGRSKWDAEEALRALAARTALEVVIVRPALVYGPGAKGNVRTLLGAIRRGLPMPLASIENRRSLVGLDNLVDLIVTCLRHPAAASQSFLVSDGEDLSTPELIRRLSAAAGVKPRLLPCPVWGLELAATLTGRSAAVQRLTGSLQVDISKARRLLGWTPPWPVDQQLRRTAGRS